MSPAQTKLCRAKDKFHRIPKYQHGRGGNNMWISSSPSTLLQQGHPQLLAQDYNAQAGLVSLQRWRLQVGLQGWQQQTSQSGWHYQTQSIWALGSRRGRIALQTSPLPAWGRVIPSAREVERWWGAPKTDCRERRFILSLVYLKLPERRLDSGRVWGLLPSNK